MQTWYNILSFLKTEAVEPVPYGIFHLCGLVLAIVLTVVLCRLYPEGDARFTRRLLLTIAIVSLTAELYRQVHYGFSLEDGRVIWDYRWYIFPFQFCSTPMYAAFIAALVPRGRLHNTLCAYLATYALFAGSAVMLYPVSIYTEVIGVNIGTTICHGSMIILGIYLLYSGYVPTEHTTLRRAIPVFGVCIVIAMILNEFARIFGILEDHTFNMFFISPYCDPSLPVYSLVQKYVPYPFCLIFYVLGFTAAAGILFWLVGRLCRRIRRRTDSFERSFL